MPESTIHAVVPQPTHEGAPPIRNLLAISQAEVGKPFTYYFGACWDRSGDFTNHVQWEDYVRRFAERRDAPLQVTIGQLKVGRAVLCAPSSKREIQSARRGLRALPHQLFACAMTFMASAVSAVIFDHAFSVTSLRSAIQEPPMAATCGSAR